MAQGGNSEREQLLESAQKALVKHNYPKAIADFEALRARDRKDAHALSRLAELYQKVGNTQKAGECAILLARLSREQGALHKASAALRQATSLLPNRPELHVELGEVLRGQGHKLEAAAEYLVAADVYEQQNARLEMLDALQKTVECDPSNAMARVRMAEAYAKQNMGAKAVAELRLAASALRGPEHEREYTKVIERIAFLDKNDAGALRELGRLYLKQNDVDHALRKLQPALQLAPRDLGVLELLVQAFRVKGDTERALAALRQLATMAIEARDKDRARGALRVILVLRPGDAEAKSQLAALNPG